MSGSAKWCQHRGRLAAKQWLSNGAKPEAIAKLAACGLQFGQTLTSGWAYLGDDGIERSDPDRYKNFTDRDYSWGFFKHVARQQRLAKKEKP
jgi:hypothetical protein